MWRNIMPATAQLWGCDLYGNLSAMAIRRLPVNHGGHRLTKHPALERSKESWLSLPCGSSHPPRIAAPPVSPELFLFVLFLNFRRLRGLRKGQRQRIAVIGRGLAALLHVGLGLQHQQVAAVDVIS